MKSLLLFAISFLCFSPLCFAQTVWPGDVNNNGIVNEVDLLYLGYAFNEIGAVRENANSDWEAQSFTEWEGTFPDGLNLAYADCNGDGIVNELDANVLEKNLGLTHIDDAFDEILVPISEIEPKFTLTSTSGLAVAPGEEIRLDVNFDNSDLIIDNILGFAITLSFDPRFFKTDQTQYEENLAAWITLQGPTINQVYSNETDGKLTIAYTKTDKVGISGTGAFGTTSFVIEDNIINFLNGLEEEERDTVSISIDSITVVTDDLEKISIGGTSVDLDIIGRTTSTYNPILDQIKMYPNPTNDWLLLKSKEVVIERVCLVNALGQVVYRKQLNNLTFQPLDLRGIPEGIYWLQMITPLGMKSLPIQKL